MGPIESKKVNKGGTMNTQAYDTNIQDYFEYHGNTAVEMTRKVSGYIIRRDWILFDSVAEAQAFYNEHCGDQLIQ